MLSQPPMYPTDETPNEIVTAENMPIFRRFLQISSTGSGEFPESRIGKNFTEQERASIARTLAELRASGFYPDGIDERGNVKWLVATKSDVHQYRDKGMDRLKGMSHQELAREAKRYGPVVQDMPKPANYDYDYERVMNR